MSGRVFSTCAGSSVMLSSSALAIPMGESLRAARLAPPTDALPAEAFATGSISPAEFSRATTLYTMEEVGAPEPVTSLVPTPYESTGAAAREAIAYSSRSLVTVIFVCSFPKESSSSRTRCAVATRSPESRRTPPSSSPASSTAVRTALSTS